MSDNQRSLGIGIYGAGQVSRQYAEAIARHPNTKLTGIASRRRSSAEKLASECAPDAAVYDSYDELLDSPDIDVVALSIPNHLHAQTAIAAFRAGKHVILEKPPGLTMEELRELKEAAAEAGTKSVVSFVLRWHPMITNLKSALDARAIGDIYYAEADYWHGIKQSFSSYDWIRKKEFAGGAMYTGGCHAVDIIRYLSGHEITEVSAYAHAGRADFDYPTTIVGAVKFDNGAVGKLSASLDGLRFPYQFNIDLLGSEGAIRDNRLYSEPLFPAQNDWITLPSSTPNSGAVEHHPFAEVLGDLVDAIHGGSSVLSDVNDAIKSMAVVLALEESAQTGTPVEVREP